MISHNKQARSKILLTKATDKKLLERLVDDCRGFQERVKQWDATNKLDRLLSLQRPVKILLKRSMKLSNWRVQSGFDERRILSTTTQYRTHSVTLLWAHNLLLEGVADRDWGITSTMAMVAFTGKSCFRIFYVTNYGLSYSLLLCHA